MGLIGCGVVDAGDERAHGRGQDCRALAHRSLMRSSGVFFNNSREDIVFSLFEWIRVVIASQRFFGFERTWNTLRQMTLAWTCFVPPMNKGGCAKSWDQVNKCMWWMPWRSQAMKDVAACEKLRGAGKRALIRRYPNGETRPARVIPR